MDLRDLGEGLASDVCMGSGDQDTDSTSRKRSHGKFHQDLMIGLFPEAIFSKTPICRQLATPTVLHPDSGWLGSHRKWSSFHIHIHGNMPAVFQLNESWLQNSMSDFMCLKRLAGQRSWDSFLLGTT